MQKPICLAPNSEFFIALCQSHIHSYVTVGVKNGNETMVLAAVGKYYNAGDGLCEVQSNVKRGDGPFVVTSHIEDERFMFHEKRDIQVKYKAYAISYKNYLQMLDYLSKLSKSQKKVIECKSLHAYCPSLEDPSVLTWQDIDNYKKEKATEFDFVMALGRLGRLSLTNSCRHSAIQLMEQCRQQSNLGAGISSLFFIKPPLSAVFRAGKTTSATPYFYVLPSPPAAFEGMSSEKRYIVTQLYRRLDKIILSEQKSIITRRKFEELKELYNDVIGHDQPSTQAIMAGISAWEKENKWLIGTHRKDHFFPFKTATETMFSQLHEKFDTPQKQEKCDRGQNTEVWNRPRF